jgi:carboxymethylenebutenolidase
MQSVESVHVPHGNVAMRAFLARAEQPGPGVVVIHDIMGLGADFKRIAGRFADNGYTALVPDLYDGAGSKALCVARTVLASTRGEGDAFDRLDSAKGYLGALDGVDPDRIGVVGFCMGGGFAILLAARGGLGACAPFYGPVPAAAEALRGICPVVGGFGEADRAFAAQGRRLIDHLTELGVPHDVVLYPGVGHSYMNDHRTALFRAGRYGPMRAAYDHASSEDSWERMLRFFGEHL